MTIALVEWNWAGHHPTYFKEYVKALLALGHRVLAGCPAPDEVRDWLRIEVGEGAVDDASARLELASFHRPDGPAIYPRRFRPHARCLRLAAALRRLLGDWERRAGTSIDLVFFACIYDDDFRWFHLARRWFPWRWSGLYLHCRALRLPGTPVPQTGEIPRPDVIFSHPALRSVAVLDEGVVEAFRRLVGPGHRVVPFPDFCDERVPPDPTPLERRIRRCADGAPVVGSLGHLQSTKGTADLARLALEPANEHLFFVFAGPLVRVHFPADEIAVIEQAALERANTFGFFQRIPDGPAFNGVIRACDVLYAAYRDFPNSSNILTKAAVFEKPVIVSDGHLMAERVRDYRLGEVIPEGDLPAAAAALTRITDDVPGWIERHRPRWSEYRALHSRARLEGAFRDLLEA